MQSRDLSLLLRMLSSADFFQVLWFIVISTNGKNHSFQK